MSVTISVVVPVHTDTAVLHRCLTHLSGTKPPADEVILVADGGVPGMEQLAAAHGARLVGVEKRGGPAHARNAGAQAAHGDILLFIDSDVAVQRESVGQVAAAFEADPRLTAAFGSYDDSPLEPNLLSQYKNLLHHHVHQTAPENVSSFWAGCGAIRRDVFLAVGGFDERYRRPAIEDIELGHRLSKSGHETRLLRSLQCKHLKRWTAASLLLSDFWDRAVPWTRLLLRERNMPSHLNLRWANRLCVALALLLSLCTVAAFWQPAVASAAVVACTLGLVGLDWRLWRFFVRKRGLSFCLLILPWHWFHYVYSGLAFVSGAVLHGLSATTEGAGGGLSHDVLPQGRER